MSKTIHEIVPDADTLLAMEPEELAGVVLEHLNSLTERESKPHRRNFGMVYTVEGFPHERKEELLRALMEGWMWLEREGLLVPSPGSDGHFFVTRRAQKLGTRGDFESYRAAARLPRGLLHPRIAQRSWAAFIRGEYDTAVFQSFKQVEVEVREVGGFKDSDFGTELMRAAFHEETGPLADQTRLTNERQSLGHLMAGAIGLYKNPHSHRDVPIDVDEASRLLIFASHLLDIVDSRRTEEDE